MLSAHSKGRFIFRAYFIRELRALIWHDGWKLKKKWGQLKWRLWSVWRISGASAYWRLSHHLDFVSRGRWWSFKWLQCGLFFGTPCSVMNFVHVEYGFMKADSLRHPEVSSRIIGIHLRYRIFFYLIWKLFVLQATKYYQHFSQAKWRGQLT